MGGALRHMGNRDVFYAMLALFVALSLAPPVAAARCSMWWSPPGSQCYWLACVAHYVAHGRKPRADAE